MIIEVLFPEIANLYGDLQNIDYLKRVDESIEIVEDNLVREPYFAKNVPDLIYMGTTTEMGQKLAVEALFPYKERIKELINQGVYFLFTGNAFEILGENINNENGFELDGLGIFPIVTKGNLMKRFNSLYLGNFETENFEKGSAIQQTETSTIKIVGFKSQFGHSYWTKNREKKFSHVFDTIRGVGLNPEIMEEGVRINNFLGTYIIGPILVLNPFFTKWLLYKVDNKMYELPFEDAAIKAYNVRVSEYSEPDRGFYY